MANYTLSAKLRVDDGMTAKLRSAQRAAENLTRGVGDLKRQDLIWRVGVEGLEKIKRLQSMAKGMKFSPIKITAQDNATSKISKLKADIQSLAGKAHNVVVNVQTRGAEQLSRLKSNVGEMANGMLMAGGMGVMGVAGLGYGLADTLNTYKEFDYQMRRNKALFTTGMDAGEANAIYQQLTETARKYGSTMIFTNSEVGKALEYMALAGWDANTSMAALPSVLNASVASGEDLAMVSDIITDDMTAMGYRAGTYVKNGMGEMVEATQHFSDVLLRTTLRSNTNFQQLGLAMKYAAPLAHSLGYNIEDFAIAMGLMANNGIKADQAGTALRGLLVRMAKAPKQAAEAMEALGVSAFDAAGKSKGLMQNLMQIRAALKGKDAESMLDFVEAMTGEEIGQRGEVADFIKQEMAANGGKLTDASLAKLASQFSGTYALAGFLAMMNSTDEDIQKLMTEIYQNADGTGNEINREMMDTLQGDLKTIQSAWEDLQYELMEGKGADGLRSFLQAATADINAFKNALKDGFDLGDIFGLLSNVVTQLKNKFLEFDGIGSILAGGVLMVGLKKLLNMGLRVKNMLGEITKFGATSAMTNAAATRTTGLPATSPMSSVGTMNVRAGVVNLSGAIKGGVNGGANGGRGGNPRQVSPMVAAQREADKAMRAAERARATSDRALATAWANPGKARQLEAYRNADARYRQAEARYQDANRRLTALRNSETYANDYYARRSDAIANMGIGSSRAQAAMDRMASEQRAMRIANARGAAGGGAALAALFGAMDYASTRSMGQSRVADADAQIAEQRRVLEELRNANANQDQIDNQIAAIQDLETARNDIIRQNANDERSALAGAAGSVAGTAIGAALGSLLGPMGTMLGGMVGGMIGDQVGRMAGEMGNERENARQPLQRDEVNAAPIREAFAEQSGLNAAMRRAQGEREQFEFTKPLAARQPTDRTGLLHQGNFFEAGQPLPAPTPTPTADLSNLGYGHGRERVLHGDAFLADYEAETNRLREEAATNQRERYARQAQGGTALWNQGANFDAFSEGAKALQEFQTLTPTVQAMHKTTAPVERFTSWLNEVTGGRQTQMRTDQMSLSPTDFTTTTTPFKNLNGDFNLGEMLSNLFFSKAAASELNEAQLAQQAAMERGETVTPTTSPEIQSPELGVAGLQDNLLSQLGSLGEGVSEIFNSLGTTIGDGLNSVLEGASETFSTFETTIQEGLTGAFEGVGEMFSGLGEMIQMGLTSIVEGASETFSTFGMMIQEGLTGAFEGVGEMFSGLGEMIQTGLTSIVEGASETFPTFGMMIQEGLTNSFAGVGETFSNLAMMIQSGMESARAAAEGSISAIKASFDSGIQSIQAVWGALPGFFSGVFSGLGGAASAAGAAIASGLTAVIGTVIGAWQSAAATISGIISSIASAAASVGSMLPSFGGIGSNYTGTASFEGGFTEVNEHGGELMILPRGTKIYPHATTQEILRHEIRDRIRAQEDMSEFGIGDLNFPMPNQFNNLDGLQPPSQSTLPVPSFNLPESNSSNSSTNNSTTNNSNSQATFNFGGVNISSGMDFDEFVHRLRSLFQHSADNSVQY